MIAVTRRTFLAGAATSAALLVDPAAALAAPIFDRTPRSLGACAVVGDSLSAGWVPGLAKELAARGLGPLDLEVRGGRSINTTRRPFDSGATIVDRLRRRGFDPPVWIVALGGNDFADFRRGRLVAGDEIRRLLDQLGDRRVGWPTIFHKCSPTSSALFNEALHEVAGERPQLVVETGWAELARAHRATWFRPDGIHFKGAAVKARNVMLADLAAGCAASLTSP